MSEDETRSSREAPEIAELEPLLGFREFLKHKAEETGARDRHRRRTEWLGAIQRLLDQVRSWLRQSDPEEVLDIESYEVSRTEQELGTYDAPALKIRLGASEVDVLPMGREVPLMTNSGAARAEFAGRVDITDGFRKYNLYRRLDEGRDSWQIRDNRDQFTPLNSGSFVQVLQDLFS